MPLSGRADRGAVGDADLRLHQIDAGHDLGDRVLDLDARVDLDEVERPGVVVDQELDGAGVVVVDRAADPERAVVDRGPGLGVEVMRRRALDDLLVAPLHRAVPLVQMHQIAVVVAEDLDLDMAGAADQLLEIDLVIAERRQALAPRRLDRVGEPRLVLDRAHAAPAAAPARLQHDGKADRAGEPGRLVGVARQRAGRRHHGHARFLGDPARRDLVAEPAHDLRPRADEGDSLRRAGLGEVRVLRQEPVARVDRVRRVVARHADRLVDAEIGLDRAHAAPHRIGLVRLEAVQREAVLLGVDGDRPDAELDGSAQRADGDLAPVGDQDAAEIGLRRVDHGGLANGSRRRILALCPATGQRPDPAARPPAPRGFALPSPAATLGGTRHAGA